MADNENPGQDPNPGGNEGDGGQGTTPQTFTQEQVNALLGRTRQEARERLQKDLAEKYGDLEGLKELAEKWQSHEESQQTEAERLAAEHKKALEKKEKALEDLQGANEALSQQLEDLVLRGEVEKQARAMGVDPDVAWAMIDRGQLSLDEKGQAVGVKPALETLKKEKPALFGASTPGSPPNHPSGGTGGTPAEAAEKVREELRKRRYRL